MLVNKKIFFIGIVVSMLTATGCAIKTDPDAVNADGRSLACIEESLVKYAMFEPNHKLATLDSSLECREVYQEDSTKYTSEHNTKFNDLEKKLAAARLNADDEYESDLSDKELFGYIGLNTAARSEANGQADKYGKMRDEFKSLYKSYIACLDFNLAVKRETASLSVTSGQKKAIINQCTYIIDRYLMPNGPLPENAKNTTIRSVSVDKRRDSLVAHSMQYLDSKLKQNNRNDLVNKPSLKGGVL